MTRSADDAKRFKGRHALTYPIWVDTEEAIFDKFVDSLIPWNAVIDATGKVRYTKVGEEGAIGEIRKVLDELLKK